MNVHVIVIFQIIGILLLKETIVIQGFTVQKLAVIYKKPLPVNVISFDGIDIVLQLLYSKSNWVTKLSKEIYLSDDRLERDLAWRPFPH